MAFYISDANGNLTKYASSASNANEVDLSDYYTITQVDDKLANYYYTSTTIDTKLNSYVTSTALSTTLSSYATTDSLDGYQTKLTFDTTPTDSSTNPVTSGGIYSTLSNYALSSDLSDYAKTSDLTNYQTIGNLSTSISSSSTDTTYPSSKTVYDYLTSNYYTSGSIDDTVSDLKDSISAIPKFAIEVVDSLPTDDISDSTIYLVKSGDDTNNLYTEYIYKDGAFEELGTQTLDISGKVDKESSTTDSYNYIFNGDSGSSNYALGLYAADTVYGEDPTVASSFALNKNGITILISDTTDDTHTIGIQNFITTEYYALNFFSGDNASSLFLNDTMAGFGVGYGSLSGTSTTLTSTFNENIVSNLIKPSSDATVDLGETANRWKDLYLSGNLSDGTYTSTISDIATLTNATKVYLHRIKLSLVNSAKTESAGITLDYYSEDSTEYTDLIFTSLYTLSDSLPCTGYYTISSGSGAAYSIYMNSSYTTAVVINGSIELSLDTSSCSITDTIVGYVLK